MDFDLDETQELIKAAASRFGQDVDSFDRRRTANGRVAADLWLTLAEMGWTAIASSEDLGGLGGRAEDIAVLMMESGAGAAAPFLIGNVILPSFLLGDRQHENVVKTLGAVISGEIIVAFAGYEPGRRYDLASPATHAVRSGGHYVLSGAKSLVISGTRPDHLIISARIEENGASGNALFLVDTSQAGVTCLEYRLIDGSSAFEVMLDEVFVDGDRLVSGSPCAGHLIDKAIGMAIVGLCAGIIGCMERAIRLCVDHLKLREQFGRPLAEFQSLQHCVADMFIATNEAKSMLFAAVAGLSGPARERQRALSACKVNVMTAGTWVTGQAIHLHGGIGFTKEHEVGYLFQRAVVAQRLLGDNDFHFTRYMALSEDRGGPKGGPGAL